MCSIVTDDMDTIYILTIRSSWIATREPCHSMTIAHESLSILVHDLLCSSCMWMMEILPCEEEDVLVSGLHDILDVSLPLDDIEWTTDDLFVDIGDIESDETECHEGDAEYPRIEYHDEDDVGERELVDCELVYDNYDSEYRGDSCDSESEYPYELEREEGESHQIVHGETYELTIAVTRLSCETLTRIEYEGISRVAHPVDETSVHTILLSESEIRLCNIS